MSCKLLFAMLLLCPTLLFAQGSKLHFVLETGVRGQDVRLASDLTQWNTEGLPHLSFQLRESAPGRYELALPEPWLPRVSYKFIVDGRWTEDPAASKRVSDGHGGFNSVIDVRGFREDPLLSARPGVPRWQARQLWLRDLEGAERRVLLLAPPFALRAEKPMVVAYFHDGQDYLERAGVANLLANLSMKGDMPLLAGVFIPPKERMREYDHSDAYAGFVAKVVVPEAERELGLTIGAERRLLIGASMGGLISLYTALKHPRVFRYVASQSGSLWKDDGRILALVKNYDGPKLRVFHDVGLFEHGKMVSYNRQGREVMEGGGHAVRYREYPSTHDWVGWRNRLSETFAYFFKRRA